MIKTHLDAHNLLLAINNTSQSPLYGITAMVQKCSAHWRLVSENIRSPLHRCGLSISRLFSSGAAVFTSSEIYLEVFLCFLLHRREISALIQCICSSSSSNNNMLPIALHRKHATIAKIESPENTPLLHCGYCLIKSDILGTSVCYIVKRYLQTHEVCFPKKSIEINQI